MASRKRAYSSLPDGDSTYFFTFVFIYFYETDKKAFSLMEVVQRMASKQSTNNKTNLKENKVSS